MADTTIDIKAKDKVSPVLKKIELEMAGFKRQIDSFSAGFHKMLSVGRGVGATATLANLVKGSLDAQIALQRLELSYKSVFGEGAAAQLQAVYEQTQRVGLEYTSTAEAAKSFFAAGQDSTLAPDMNRIFTSVTNAGAALQLSTDQMNGAFIALGQMISKGKVQAEELRGQLGERLPGAFQMAAKAMGMTTAELDKFMADGKLTAEELLPRLAEVLEEKYGNAAEAAANTVQGSINRMSTEWTRFKAGLVESGPAVFAINIVTSVLKESNDEIEWVKEKARIDAKLEADGARKAPQIIMDDAGNIDIEYGYTETQRENVRIEKRQKSYFDQWLANQEKLDEKALADARANLNKALKNTPGQKRADLQAEWDAGIAGIKELRKKYTVDIRDAEERRKALAELDDQEAAVNKKYQGKIDALNKTKKTAGQKLAEKTQKTVDSFRGETEQLLAEVASLRESLESAGGSLDKTEMDAAKAEAALAKKQASPKWQAVSAANPLEYERRIAAERDKIKLQSRQRDEQINKDFLEDARKTLTSHYDLERAALEEEYRLYSRHVTDRELLDQWYARRQEELARDPISGMKRAWRDYYADATDYATGFEQVATQGLNGVSSTLTSVLWKGEQDFASFFQSIGQMLTELALKASVAQIGGGLAGLLGDLFSSSITLPGFTSADLNTSSWGGAKVKHGGGMGWESSFYRPVPRMLFARAPRFHKGRYYDPATELPAIIRKDESVLTPGQMRAIAAAPVPRVLPVDTGRNTARNAAPVVNITVINQAGAEVETSQQTNSDGGIDLKIMMLKEVARDTARRGGFNNNVLRNQFGASKKPIKY